MEKRIEDIINSGSNLPEVELPDGLYNKLIKIPQEVSETIIEMTPRARWMAIAGIALVTVLNTLLVFYYKSNAVVSSDLTDSYFSYLNQL